MHILHQQCYFITMKNIWPCCDPVKNHSQNEGYFTAITAKAFITGYDVMCVWMCVWTSLTKQMRALTCLLALLFYQAECLSSRHMEEGGMLLRRENRPAGKNLWCKGYRSTKSVTASQNVGGRTCWTRRLMKEAKVWEVRNGIRQTKRSKAKYTWGWLGLWEKNIENTVDVGREG